MISLKIIRSKLHIQLGSNIGLFVPLQVHLSYLFEVCFTLDF